MNITELLSNPSMIHAAVVHMPIAAAFIGIIFIVISAIFHRNNTVRSLAALLFLIVVASSYVAIESGEDARDLVSSELPNAIWDPLTAPCRQRGKGALRGYIHARMSPDFPHPL